MDARSARLLLVISAALSPAPRVGQHSRAVLAEFGFGDDEIDRLLADEVVWEG